MSESIIEKWVRYLKILKGFNPASVKLYHSHVAEFTGWLEKDERYQGLDQIGRKDIEEYLIKMFRRGNVNRTRATKLIAIRSLLDFMVYEELIPNSPANGIPMPKLWQARMVRFSKNEILSMFRQMDINTEIGRRNVCILILSAFAGLRRSEITNLNVEDIIYSGRSVDIEVKGKMNTYRRVYLWASPSSFIKHLQQERMLTEDNPAAPMFVSIFGKTPGKRISKEYINKMIIKHCRKANLTRSKPHHHMLRAAHATDLRHIKGYDILAIAQRLGHKSINTTEHYITERGRIHKVYPSLADFWSEFPDIWKTDRKQQS